MRCRECNVILTDFEATRRYANTGCDHDYVDLCDKHFANIADLVTVIVRRDLRDDSFEDYDE
jgi:hypothetical protein